VEGYKLEPKHIRKIPKALIGSACPRDRRSSSLSKAAPRPRRRDPRRACERAGRIAFLHQSLAQQILDCFVTCRIDITTEDERQARRLAAVAPPPGGPLENLRYTIEAYEGDKLVAVLVRETLAAPAIAA
jgi:hypothetical protein